MILRRWESVVVVRYPRGPVVRTMLLRRHFSRRAAVAFAGEIAERPAIQKSAREGKPRLLVEPGARRRA